MKIAWISEFPVEWMPDAPVSIRNLPKQHPATWMPILAAELACRSEVELHVIVLRNNISASDMFVAGNVRYHLIKVDKGTRITSMFWADTTAIRRKLVEIQPDLIHAWGTERGAALVASRLNRPYLVTMQGILSWYKKMIPFSLHDQCAWVFEEIALRRARYVTTECVFAADYLCRRYPHLRVTQAEHAPNWIFHRVERRPQTKPVRLLFVGTPGHRKGTDLLLLGLDQVASTLDFELVIIGGGGSYIDGIRPRLSPEMQRRLKIVATLMPDGVMRELSTATLLLMPTRVDTSPNAVKEAVVAGVPVVASAIGGIIDYVKPGLNGFTFKAGSLESFVAALREAIAHPTISKGVVDAGCLAEMRRYLSPSQMGENFLNAYRQVLSDN